MNNIVQLRKCVIFYGGFLGLELYGGRLKQFQDNALNNGYIKARITTASLAEPWQLHRCGCVLLIFHICDGYACPPCDN